VSNPHDDDFKAPPGNMLMHLPLPYVVRVRITHDDAVPSEQRVIKVVAYSILEAHMQAVLEAGGQSLMPDPKIAIESIGPDEPEFSRRAMIAALNDLVRDSQFSEKKNPKR
jgi:hypothetical protein